MERTLVLIKPDAIRRDLWLPIIDMYRHAGLHIARSRIFQMPDALCRELYVEHQTKPWIDEVVGYMISGPIMALVLEAEDAIQRVRRLNGATHHAEPGTIRAKYSEGGYKNSVHGSDSTESAEREIALFFGGRD